MSILDRGKHSVTVVPQVTTTDEYGGIVTTDGPPVTVSGCQVQPTTAEESDSLGMQATTIYRVIGRGPWPGGIVSRVEWDGREWDQIGEARQYTNGRRTGHFDTLIRARSAEVK